MSHQRKTKRFPILRILLFLAGTYVAFCAYLYLVQDSQIFFPTTMTEERWQQVAEELNGDYATIRVNREGVHLQGWFFQAYAANGSKLEAPAPTIIFFGGNAMKLDHMAYTLDPIRHAGIHILLTDYRGYGLSEGTPSADTMKQDAEKLFDAAASHPLVDPNRIVAWGVSLGTGIASYLADVKPLWKVILLAPYTTTEDVARSMYPFVPVSLLLKHKLSNIGPHTQPALIVHGERDVQLSYEHAQKVANAWGGPAELVIVPKRGHDDLLDDQEVWARLVSFITGAAEEI